MLSEINLENTKPNSNIIDTLTKSLPQYTIFYAIYTLYRILYIFLFLVPHITNKFKNYISFIFETNTSFKHELLDYVESEDNLNNMKQFINHSKKTSNNIKDRSQNVKKKINWY